MYASQSAELLTVRHGASQTSSATYVSHQRSSLSTARSVATLNSVSAHPKPVSDVLHGQAALPSRICAATYTPALSASTKALPISPTASSSVTNIAPLSPTHFAPNLASMMSMTHDASFSTSLRESSSILQQRHFGSLQSGAR